MGHHHCHKSKCKYNIFKDGNEKIILQGRHGSSKLAFCEQVRAFPLGHRKYS